MTLTFDWKNFREVMPDSNRTIIVKHSDRIYIGQLDGDVSYRYTRSPDAMSPQFFPLYSITGNEILPKSLKMRDGVTILIYNREWWKVRYPDSNIDPHDFQWDYWNGIWI